MLQEKLHFHLHRRISTFLSALSHQRSNAGIIARAWKQVVEGTFNRGLRALFEYKIKPQIVAKLLSTLFSYGYLVGSDNMLWVTDTLLKGYVGDNESPEGTGDDDSLVKPLYPKYDQYIDVPIAELPGGKKAKIGIGAASARDGLSNRSRRPSQDKLATDAGH